MVIQKLNFGITAAVEEALTQRKYFTDKPNVNPKLQFYMDDLKLIF